MKKHLNYWLAMALLLPVLNACQDDGAMSGEEPGEAGNPTVVHAAITGEAPGTRAQVQWGTQDAEAGELFMWNTNDLFLAYKDGTTTPSTFNIQNYNEAQPGKEADFSCNNFTADAGTKVVAFHVRGYLQNPQWNTENSRKYLKVKIVDDNASATTQEQQDSPGNADLNHLKYGLNMYATGEADGNGGISPLSFRHLSALFRFTITNRQADAAQIKSITLGFPNQSVLCTAKTVKIWEDNTMTSTVEETDKLTEKTLDLKKGSQQYATIASGSSYDCFLPVMPAAEESNKATGATIKITFKDGTTKSADIDGFSNVEIKAGMRYWFDLTITAEGKLMQTSRLPKPYEWYTSNKDATIFTLSTVAELREFANLVNGTDEAKAAANVSGPVTFSGKTVRIADEVTTLDLNNEEWTPIGGSMQQPFSGTFDGNGSHISKLNVDVSTNYAGLFGWVNGGTVRNLRVSGTVKSSGIQVGGIAGVLNSSSTVKNCIFSGEVSGKNYVGGIAGNNSNNSSITGCHTNGSVTATDESNCFAGGIVGSASGSVGDCYSSATVSATGNISGGVTGGIGNGFTVTRCYATGAVSGKEYVGGIAGSSKGTVEYCLALNPSLTRTTGTNIHFGRITSYWSSSSAVVTSCAAFKDMTLTDATTNETITNRTGADGDNLDASACLAKTTYTDKGFSEATADVSGWAFDTDNTPWHYLPWNKAFETFRGISETDYRIAVPSHLTSN